VISSGRLSGKRYTAKEIHQLGVFSVPFELDEGKHNDMVVHLCDKSALQ